MGRLEDSHGLGESLKSLGKVNDGGSLGKDGNCAVPLLEIYFVSLDTRRKSDVPLC